MCVGEPKVTVKGKTLHLGDSVTVLTVVGTTISGVLCSWCDSFNGCSEEDTYDIDGDDGSMYTLSSSEMASVERMRYETEDA